jgi:phosphatidate cytidylyltransferase
MSPASPAPKQAQDSTNLRIRLLTAAILGPIIIALILVGDWPFYTLVIAGGVLGLLEFCALGEGRGWMGITQAGVPAMLLLLMSFANGQPGLFPAIFLMAAVIAALIDSVRGVPIPERPPHVLVTLAGLLYIGFPLAFMIAIRGRADGLNWLAFIMATTWTTDTFAYIGGRWWGKHKLAPQISPKKTVEGAVTGVAAGLVAGLIVLASAGYLTVGTVLLAAVVPVMAVLGDLLESWIKRRLGAGDSHLTGLDIIPGHGGVLDRVDSLILVTVLVYVYLLVMGS